MNKVLLIFVILFAYGCAKTATQPTVEVQYITEYREVAVPVPCDVTPKSRPVLNKNNTVAVTLNDLLLYIESLEADLEYCRGRNEH